MDIHALPVPLDVDRCDMQVRMRGIKMLVGDIGLLAKAQFFHIFRSDLLELSNVQLVIGMEVQRDVERIGPGPCIQAGQLLKPKELLVEVQPIDIRRKAASQDQLCPALLDLILVVDQYPADRFSAYDLGNHFSASLAINANSRSILASALTSSSTVRSAWKFFSPADFTALK